MTATPLNVGAWLDNLREIYHGTMEVPSASQESTLAPIADNASDYGSEIDDATALELLSQAESQPLKDVVLESIEEPEVKDEPLHERVALRLSRLQQSLGSVHESSSRLESLISESRDREASIEVEYDERNRTAFSRTSRLCANLYLADTLTGRGL